MHLLRSMKQLRELHIRLRQKVEVQAGAGDLGKA
jgi:hypothetical protein